MGNLIQLRGEEKPFISPSQITLYQKCPKAWEFRYIIKPPLAMESDPSRAMGSAVHAAINQDIRSFIESHHWQPVDSMRSRVQKELANELLALKLNPGEFAYEFDEAEAEAQKIITLWKEEIRDELWPIASEVEVKLDCGAFYVKGSIDLVDGRYGERHPSIVDWKISASKWPLDAKNWIAGRFYAAGWERMTENTPETLKLIRIRRLKRVPKLEADEVTYTPELEDLFRMEAGTTVQLIESSHFEPDGLGTPLCVRYCDYREFCKPYEEWRMNDDQSPSYEQLAGD